MTNYITTFVKIVLTLVWLAMGVLVIGYPSLIEFSTHPSTRHSVFTIGFVACVILNIFSLWRKPKVSPFASVGDRVLSAMTVICIWGLI